MLFNKIRNIAFNLVDFMSGGGINNHYKEIHTLLDLSPQKKVLDECKIKMDDLLVHATSTTDFYKPYKDLKDLNNFPVIKKSMVQENFEKFQSKQYLNKMYHKVSTSGSTGAPFFLFHDRNKRNRNTADVIYYFSKTGFKIGNRLYEFEVWRGHNKKGRIKSLMQNVYQFDVSKLTDNKILELLKILKKDKAPKAFLGFSSAYETICQFIVRNNGNILSDFNVSTIIANSEYLNKYTKTTMSKFFNAPVFSRYSNEELGLIAQQIEGSGEDFVINWASYYIELLDFNSDNPVNPGSPGRIVVTDLYNRCMPLIRFDTGDVGVFTSSNNDELPNFKQVEGRKMDIIYDTSGNIVSSFVVYTKFYNLYKFLKQYQFIQIDKKEYLIKLNLIDVNFELEKELIDDVKKDFGKDAIIKIEYVDEIPLLASGKRKKVMSLYEKSPK